ncbi:DNA mismatch endonuclease Vsr [Sinorhizobium meliloti]|uniref:Very short patch repair endonuclease n=1 Tax=Rhizobium meliloti TaxID=382 RepID=A0A6A7ZU29_RHIML|nr:DNA mismatch endonuclease Vsr [Sinorhizobium meliloti]MQW06366.1 DNA mismatch endonuclease Vsr [Sinorhizobium meliloti]
MADRFPPEHRSWLMSRISQKNTMPEMKVRKAAHALGFRFRLHRKDLPGKPDVVFPSRKAAIFVHGCFWHQHPGCRKASIPETRKDFWLAKLQRNVHRDVENVEALTTRGWKVLIVWECETRDTDILTGSLLRFLR